MCAPKTARGNRQRAGVKVVVFRDEETRRTFALRVHIQLLVLRVEVDALASFGVAVVVPKAIYQLLKIAVCGIIAVHVLINPHSQRGKRVDLAGAHNERLESQIQLARLVLIDFSHIYLHLGPAPLGAGP